MEGPGLQGEFAYLLVRNVGSWLVGWSGLRVRLGMCESVGEAGVSVGVVLVERGKELCNWG